MATTTVMHTLFMHRSQRVPPENFYADVVRGLTDTPKHLDSKYFYDAAGDRLFQQIMRCREYYLTDCEMEIMREQAPQICDAIRSHAGSFDIIELGAGDATKSVFLLEQLLEENTGFTYYPVDISANVISLLEKELPKKLPALHMQGLNGEYFDMLEQLGSHSSGNKVLLFMGGNIGNFTPDNARKFCRTLRRHLHPGDLLLIGFDLKKHPQVILEAYNDSQGLTRAFNLNLLLRINRELGADFNITRFEHYPNYDPGTGACKSYLVSLEEQQVRIGKDVRIDFGLYEPLFMEISQKYSYPETTEMAAQTGFRPVASFFDNKKWFVDCLWQAE